jgi:2-polyprenyl-6-methoxyphenol hydroxylase-like FAD-dependent oxidoreductase
MAQKRVLVVGLGIAGMAAAVRLRRLGWDVVILEKAASRRQGGYFIALFGAGVAAAERLGIGDLVPDRSVPGTINYSVKRNGTRKPGPSYASLIGRARMMVRGDVEGAIYAALGDDADIRYCCTPQALREDADGVEVDILNQQTGETTTERFDLVVGADGVRSTVRRLAFAPDKARIHPLNYMVANCALQRPIPGYLPHEGLRLAEGGRSARVYRFTDKPSQVSFTYRTDDVDAQFKLRPIDALRRVFGPDDLGPVLGWLLDEFETAPEQMFDSVEQVRADTWYQGRVVLLGDSAWCMTLYSGMGASTGLAAADLLGSMLERYPDEMQRALQAWEDQLRPFIAYHMEAGMKQRSYFVPASRTEHLVQKVMYTLMQLPQVGKMLRPGPRDGMMKKMDIAAVEA